MYLSMVPGDLNCTFTSLLYSYMTCEVPSYHPEIICWTIPKNICRSLGII